MEQNEEANFSSFYSEKSSMESLSSFQVIFENMEQKIFFGKKYPSKEDSEEESQSLMSEDNRIINDFVWNNIRNMNNMNLINQIKMVKIYLYIFLSLTLSEIFLEFLYDYLGVVHYSSDIENVAEMYKKISGINTHWIFNFLSIIDLGWQFCYYPFAIISFYKKRIKFIDYLNFLALLGVISEMM